MAGFNGMFVARVSGFNKAGAESDSNGHRNIILEPLCGKCPSKRVLAGTLALGQGMIVGDTILVSFTEKEEDPEYGRQFQFVNGGRLTTLEWIGLKKEFGDPEILNVESGKKETPEDQIDVTENAEMAENKA